MSQEKNPLSVDRNLVSEVQTVLSGYDKTLSVALGPESATEEIDGAICTALRRAQTVKEIAVRIVRDPIFERLTRKTLNDGTSEFLTLVQQLTQEQHRVISEKAERIAKWRLRRLDGVTRTDIDTQAVREWRKQVGGQLRLRLMALIDEHWLDICAQTRLLPESAIKLWRGRKGEPHEKLYAVDHMASVHTGLPVRPRRKRLEPKELNPIRIVQQGSEQPTEGTARTCSEEQDCDEDHTCD